MRHRKLTLKLNRKPAHMRAMLANLVRGLFMTEAVTTTVPKAKAAQRMAEKMITLGKKNTLASRRRTVGILHDKDVVKKLFTEIAPKFSERHGGYTRVIKTGYRAGDGAPMAILELVGRNVELKQTVTAEKGEKKGKPSVKAKAAAEAKEKEKTKVEAKIGG